MLDLVAFFPLKPRRTSERGKQLLVQAALAVGGGVHHGLHRRTSDDGAHPQVGDVHTERYTMGALQCSLRCGRDPSSGQGSSRGKLRLPPGVDASPCLRDDSDGL